MTNTAPTIARTALRLAPGQCLSIWRVHVPTRLYAATYRVVYVPAASADRAYRIAGKAHGWHGLKVFGADGKRVY